MLSDTSAALAQLSAELPGGAVLTGPDATAGYRWDAANDPRAGEPLAVVRAQSTDDVQRVVRWASAHDVPIVTRGAGTGLSGGSTALDGALVLSTERMNSIRVDPDTRMVTAGPGALNAAVKAAAAEHGLWYPPDPSSFEICSIGGNVATNAGGLCCVKYGVTTDYVLGMTVVLADGRAVTLGGPRLKDVAGLPLLKLFVGSEGVLGVITEVTLRLVPLPVAPATVVALFPTLTGATQAVLEITRSLRPSMLEMMDAVAIDAVEDLTRMGLDRTAAAMLIVQSDDGGERAAHDVAAIEAACLAAGASECFATTDAEESEAFVAARRLALPALERRGTVLLEDVGVPVPRLGELVEGVAEIAARHEIEISVVAHAGDGNTHPVLIFDATDAAARARAEVAYDEVMRLAMRLDGTITGEHGVGRLKQPWLREHLGDDVYELNERIKSALDPQGLFNPGVMFPA